MIDKDLTITANNFNFNQTTNILRAKQKVEIRDLSKDILIFSDDITYYKNEDKILTKGKTEAIIESKYDILSSDVLYLRKKQEFKSSSKTILINKKKSLMN